ncbi:MAG: PAS domain S-box protein [Verrucomicrobia bacterium]|nr:PAS domain S-box protein [Verrucomicrobiota bacterium]
MKHRPHRELPSLVEIGDMIAAHADFLRHGVHGALMGIAEQSNPRTAANGHVTPHGPNGEESATQHSPAKASDGLRDPFFRLLFDQLPEALLVLDPEHPGVPGPVAVFSGGGEAVNGKPLKCLWTLGWPVVWCNEAACRQVGYSRDELVGQPAGMAGPFTEQQESLADLLERLKNQKAARFTALHRRKDGTYFPSEVAFTLIGDAGRERILSLVRNTSEQRKAHAELERLALFAKCCPQPILEFGPEGQLNYFNPAAQALAQAVGEESPSRLAPPGIARIVHECLASGKNEKQVLTRAAERTLEWCFCPVLTSGVVYGLARDATESIAGRNLLAFPPSAESSLNGFDSARMEFTQMLAALRELVEQIRRTPAKETQEPAPTVEPTEPAPPPEPAVQFKPSEVDAALTIDSDGTVLSFNTVAETLTGCRAEEIVRRRLDELNVFSAESKQAVAQTLAQLRDGLDPNPLELTVVRSDQGLASIEAVPRAVCRDGKIIGLHLTMRDVTPHKRTEEALSRRAANFVLAQQIAQVGSWELDLPTGKIEWSDETFRLLGYKPGEITPTRDTVSELIHPAHRDTLKKLSEEAVQTGQPYSSEHRIVLRDGTERWICERTAVVRDEAGSPARILGTFQDVTQRKQQEEHLRNVEKWEAIGRLAGGVAHDFNRILTDIRNCAKAIQAAPNIDANIAEQLKQLSAAAESANDLTWHLLALSRKQAKTTAFVNLNELIQQVIEMVQQVLGPEIKVELKFASELPAIPGDGSMLEQVLLNLAINSRYSMPKGGKLTIETRLCDIDAAYVAQQPEAKAGRHVCLRFSDTGGGVDTARMSCLHEPFFTTKDVGQGTGLGLATVHGIIKRHQGWIDVASDCGGGTTFKVYLPAQATATTEALAMEKPPKLICGGTETILLVDGEPLLRALARSILQRYGYRIFDAGSGADAMAIWEKEAEQIDLLLTDMALPEGLKGSDLAQQLQEKKPDLSVLYTSSYSADLTQSSRTLKPGLNFLPKPYSATALAQAARHCLDRTENRDAASAESNVSQLPVLYEAA